MKANHRQKITSHTFLLLVGVLLCFVYFLWQDTYYVGQPIALPQTYEVSLSETSPVFHYTIYQDWVGISNIETNDTYVSLIVRDSDDVFLNCTNITVLSEYVLEVPQSGLSSDWWLEIRRQTQDASVNITVYYIAQAVVSRIAPPFWAPFVGITISGFAIYRLVTTKNEKETRKKLVAITLLVIIGALFCYPLLFGISRNDFTPHTAYIHLPDQNYKFTLNTTHPNSSIDISTLYPDGESGVSFRIHSIEPSELPIQVSLTKEDTYSMILEHASNECDWSILIPSETNTSITLGIGGLGAEIEVTFSVETSYRTIIVNQDITIPLILGILGAFAIIIGFFQAIRLERTYSDNGLMIQ